MAIDPAKKDLYVLRARDRRKPYPQRIWLWVLIGLVVFLQAQGAASVVLANEHVDRVIPRGTHLQVQMVTSVLSGSSKDGDDFSVSTMEDVGVEGLTLLPQGSVITGKVRVYKNQLKNEVPEAVSFKFETIGTSQRLQIPLQVSLLGRGGSLHVHRGPNQIEFPALLLHSAHPHGVGISGPRQQRPTPTQIDKSTRFLPEPDPVVPTAVLLAKRKNPVDLRPGDEFKIALEEDLHVPVEPSQSK